MAKMNVIKLSKIAMVNCLDNTGRLFLIPVGGLIGTLFAIAFGENNIVVLFIGMVFGLSFGFVFQYNKYKG
jgi:nicotinamide riboside transporter PnuC